jgi:hypothetical protein
VSETLPWCRRNAEQLNAKRNLGILLVAAMKNTFESLLSAAYKPQPEQSELCG